MGFARWCALLDPATSHRWKISDGLMRGGGDAPSRAAFEDPFSKPEPGVEVFGQCVINLSSTRQLPPVGFSINHKGDGAEGGVVLTAASVDARQ